MDRWLALVALCLIMGFFLRGIFKATKRKPSQHDRDHNLNPPGEIQGISASTDIFIHH